MLRTWRRAGHYVASKTCHGLAGKAVQAVAELCIGKTTCTVPANTVVLNPADPSICPGVVKRTAVQLTCA